MSYYHTELSLMCTPSSTSSWRINREGCWTMNDVAMAAHDMFLRIHQRHAPTFNGVPHDIHDLQRGPSLLLPSTGSLTTSTTFNGVPTTSFNGVHQRHDMFPRIPHNMLLPSTPRHAPSDPCFPALGRWGRYRRDSGDARPNNISRSFPCRDAQHPRRSNPGAMC